MEISETITIEVPNCRKRDDRVYVRDQMREEGIPEDIIREFSEDELENWYRLKRFSEKLSKLADQKGKVLRKIEHEKIEKNRDV